MIVLREIEGSVIRKDHTNQSQENKPTSFVVIRGFFWARLIFCFGAIVIRVVTLAAAVLENGLESGCCCLGGRNGFGKWEVEMGEEVKGVVDGVFDDDSIVFELVDNNEEDCLKELSCPSCFCAGISIFFG